VLHDELVFTIHLHFGAGPFARQHAIAGLMSIGISFPGSSRPITSP
jgi:hypothetical protein